jgi:hypothetical protein|tara:strand:+ start:786 stop:1109 length:324 start_codon:yes stop_codon:yes gene_type:complete
MIKLKDILKEDKYDSKKAMDFYGALQSMLLRLKQQSDPRTSDNREYFKKVHVGLQLLKATSYHNEAKKYGQDYIKLIKKIQKLLDDFNGKINNKLNSAVSDWHKAEK